MIKMEELVNLLKYVLFTGYLKRERPVSLLIIANSESGKTEAIDKLRKSNGVIYINDATPLGMVNEFYRYQQTGKRLNHVIIPDLINPLSRSKPSVKSFVQFFKSATEEGVTKIETATIQYNIPTIKCGLITAITRPEFNFRKRYWIESGFLRRFLPFSYQYDMSMVAEIIESIYKQNHLEDVKKIKFDFPTETKEITLSPEIARMMTPYTQRLAQAEKVYGFTFQKHFQRLLKAVALCKGKSVVDTEDLKDLQKCANYINLEFNTIKG